jgi:hypothetical protein
MDIKHNVLKKTPPKLDMKAKKEMEMRADTCKAHQAKIIYELQRFES